LSGCASYKLGSHAELPFKSIYVRPATNESFAPQAQALVSAQIRQAFIRDGRVKIVSDESTADAILEVAITDYETRSRARQRNDTVTASTYRLELTAKISLFNANAGDFYFQDREIVENSGIYADNPYATTTRETQSYIRAEYNAMTRLARGVARQVADEVLSPWPTRDEELAAASVVAAEASE
jgi:hypothetical protein